MTNDDKVRSFIAIVLILSRWSIQRTRDCKNESHKLWRQLGNIRYLIPYSSNEWFTT